MELAPDRPADPTARAASRTTDGRQRMFAALVVIAAALLVRAVSGGPWAQAEITTDGSSDAAAVTQVDLRLSGDVDVEADPADAAVPAELDSDGAVRAAIGESMGGATRDLLQVLAVLILVVAAVGVVLELRSRLWGLLASASLVCLLAAAVLRDAATSALATGALRLDAGPFSVDPTGWSGLAIGAAAAAALASFLATAERGVAGRGATPVFEPDADAGTATRPRRSTPPGRVRERFLNSLPSRGR